MVRPYFQYNNSMFLCQVLFNPFYPIGYLQEVNMPSKDCVRVVNKLYCFNKENNKVLIYEEKEINLTDCPDYVLAAFINKKRGVTVTIEESKI